MFPGIGEMYSAMKHKPATFLQLVWAYESALAREANRRSKAA